MTKRGTNKSVPKTFAVPAPKLRKSDKATELLAAGQTTETSVTVDVCPCVVKADQGHIVMAGFTVCVKSSEDQCEPGVYDCVGLPLLTLSPTEQRQYRVIQKSMSAHALSILQPLCRPVNQMHITEKNITFARRF